MLLEIPVGKETAYADFLLIEGSFSYAGNIAIFVRSDHSTFYCRNSYVRFSKPTQCICRLCKRGKKGLMTAVDILPTLAGLMVAVGILRASGLLDALTRLLGNWMEHIGFPSQLVPLAVVRMFSSSAATGLLLDVYEQFGTDSRIGRIASVMMSSSETIFYTMSIYFMTVKVKKTRWTLAGALVATIAGITASTILAS